MTNSEYDFNGNGKIDPEEREIMLEDRRRKMEDADAKRDAQRRMTWFALGWAWFSTLWLSSWPLRWATARLRG
jgi:hypothetical protein